MPDQPVPPLPALRIRLADVGQRRPTPVALEPDAAGRAAVAAALDIRAVRKLRLTGTLVPEGRADWTLLAELGATVVQDCVATLAPVTTRIDEVVERRYRADLPEPEAGEVEMPEDDTVEPLPAMLDLGQVMLEALALALPPWPRAAAAGAGDIAVTEPGKSLLTDETARAFAGLAGLRDSLKNKGGGGE